MFIIYDNITAQTLSKYPPKGSPPDNIEWSDGYYNADLSQSWLPDECHRFRTRRAAIVALLCLEKLFLEHQANAELDFEIFKVHRHVLVTYRSYYKV